MLISRLIRLAAQPAVPFWLLPVFMILLTAGTVAQRYMGLYEAQKLFFSSAILWLGPLPLPGGMSVAFLLGFGLAVKFLFFSSWSRQRAGINLAHLGVIVLLAGGLVTALNTQEGFVTIPEGGASQTVSDYHQRELAVLKNGQVILRVRHENLRSGANLSAEGLPFTIEILSSCRHCHIERRNESATSARGMAQFMVLSEGKPAAQDEDNISGVTFAVRGLSEENDGIWLTFDPMPKSMIFGDFEIVYGKAQRPLPFALKLDDFTRQDYPGTGKARNYSSRLTIRDNDVEWPALIEMNKPLRYKGYTFFQSSFLQDSDGHEATVLTAVKNIGWPFPYVGAGLMAAGLLLHMVLSLFRRRRS